MDQIKLTTNKGRVFGPFGGEFSYRPATGAVLWSRSILTAASVPANQDAGYGSNSVSCHKFRGENMEKFLYIVYFHMTCFIANNFTFIGYFNFSLDT